jgi:L-threonylcarbamoyladenylate synthase
LVFEACLFMVILKLAESDIRQAARVLRSGGVVVYPTDTSYAIGCRYDRPASIHRVMAIKDRRDQKFTVIAADTQQATRHFELASALRPLAKKYWPGPLSLVVSPRLSVRVPAADVPRRLAKLAGVPLIASSANISGQPACYSIRALLRQLKTKNTGDLPDVMLDGGALPRRVPSAVVGSSRGKLIVFRSGRLRIN